MIERIRINVPDMVCQDELGEDFNLPASEELRKATLIINSACQDEVRRRKRHLLEEFVCRKLNEFHQAVNEGACTNRKKEIIMSIINYDRKNKIEL